MGDVNLEIKLSNLDERVIKIEESGSGSGGDGYITSVSNDFNVVNKKLSLSNDVTTKLSKVDTPDNLSAELAKKIDKPASATNGQVLTYNGTSNEWEAQDSKGGITEPTDLEKGIIGGDEYSETETYGTNDGLKNVCIHSNMIYSAKQASFSGVEPMVTSGWADYWEETSIGKLIGKTVSSSQIKEAGIKTIPFNNSTDGLTTINFEKSYTEAPIVIVSTRHVGVNVGIGVITTSSFSVQGRTIRGNSLNENVEFNYIVV